MQSLQSQNDGVLKPEPDAPEEREEGSEFARLRAQIELECAAFNQGLNGYRATSRHEIIQAREQRLTKTLNEASELIGQEAAVELLYEIYSRVMQ